MKRSIPDALQRARTHLDAGQWADAEAICRAVLQAVPDEFEAHLIVGAACQLAGRAAEAEHAWRRAVELNPASVPAWTNLAVALAAQDRCVEAEAAYRRALEIEPTQPTTLYNWGRILHRQGRLADAEEAYRRASAAQPGYAKAYYNRAIVLQELGRSEEAEAGYRQTLAVNPRFAEAANNLGNLLRDQGRAAEAETCYRQALEVAPGHVSALVNLGLAWARVDRLSEAEALFLAAHQNHPDAAEPMAGLGYVCRSAGRIEEAIGWLRRALQAKPRAAGIHSSLLLCLQSRPGITLAELAEAHRAWDERHARPLRTVWPPMDNDFRSPRPLRLGFVSADLAEHPVGHLLIGVFEFLAERCHAVCYYDSPRRDWMVARFRAAAGAWREVSTWSDDRLARQIRDDRIDVLVDLAGHSGDNRLLVFARRPAPVQVSWLGYPGTTGMAAMDYLVADRYQVPECDEPYYVETVLRLPDSYVAVKGVDGAPAVGPLPSAAVGHITLGSFSNPAKINAEVVRLWARLLLRLPGSRLLLKYPGLDDRPTAARLRRQFVENGVPAERVQIEGRSPRAELLAAYHRVDIALDTSPYSGGLTTLEALWMGVPVITCPGRTFAGRHALSYLSTAGLGELVADNADDYLVRAIALAGDRPRLTRVRASLRQQVAASPLGNAEGLAEHLLQQLRDAWQRRCAVAEKEHR
jgi:predicted O-linked N-acetylglucosamine transferase (SPINDLY family)